MATHDTSLLSTYDYRRLDLYQGQLRRSPVARNKTGFFACIGNNVSKHLPI
ncbi:hypothetical protein JCM19237_4758 [Photobacterium aphoticum]|uniref:Uncharacterized protein n=1 Tax=Photobacterium aphoticum TaxID=754436 RepID=A0A090QR79_9GAMM|nr:hypothetical protein JCM19237_4758 [Photobacterium aphoticum]